MIALALWRDTRGSPAVEFILVLPAVFALMFGGLEGGHYIWTQHKLVDAVRDGARFAARTPVQQLCNGATTIMTTAKRDEIRLMTRTGQLTSTSARARVRGWTAAQVSVTVNCQSFVATGIYTDLGANGPIVTVAATNVSYPSMLKALGYLNSNIVLNAKSNAPVIGI